jgi:hypothetical protein
MAEVEIQGLKVRYRDKLFGEEILYENLPTEEQYFRRLDHPFSEDDLVAIANREHSYTDLQKKWVEREKFRMNFGNGVYAYIKGRLTYLPGSYWGYINYWTLENGKKPEYRESDRKFFLFMEYCCFMTQLLAVVRGKGRRKGATSQGTYWEWWICGRNEEKIGGLVSYNSESASKIFSTMFMRGFKAMLPCFQEDFDTDSDNFIRFVKPVEKKKKGILALKREGLNSFVDYQPTTLNSYDSGRVSFLLIDEAGKWEKVDINTYWSKVSPTLCEGDYKVGFAYIPTTVNPKNKGGDNFRIFFDAANQFAINPDTGEPFGEDTPSRVVQYFDPATEGYAGCIDKYGDSVIEDPEQMMVGNDGRLITQGSRAKILARRKQLEGDRLMEHRRDFPLDIYDLFAFATGQCEFNEENLVRQIQYLEENPAVAYWRRARLYEEWVDARVEGKAVKKRVIDYADDPKGDWWIKETPNEANKFIDGTRIEPQNTLFYEGGADTYRNIFAIEGSDGVLLFFKKSCIINGEETGLYPVAIFVGRPKLIKQFNNQALLGCLWYGCKINFEIDAGTWFYEDFSEWGALKLLEWEPARDPLRRERMIKPGTESAQPFQLAKQLEVAKMYFDGNRTDAYNGNVQRVTFLPLLKQALEYNHSERTPYHLVVALMMALLPCLASPPPPKSSSVSTPLLRTYKVKMPS